MNWLMALLLGIVQGITEWLPVSSSGHLALVQYLTGEEPPLLFDIFLHLGTLVVVLWVLRAEVVLALRALPKLGRRLVTRGGRGGPPGTGEAMVTDTEELRVEAEGPSGQGPAPGEGETAPRSPPDPPLTPEERMVLMVLLGSIPTAIVGLAIDRWFIADFFADMRLVGLGLLFTAAALWYGHRPRGDHDFGSVPLAVGFWVGLAQGLAVMPGVSRSGLTIVAGQVAGLEPRTAARLSFLLFIPAVLGAALLNLGELDELGAEVGLRELAIGTVAAMVTGFVALKLLLAVVERQRFHWFIPYCLGLGGLLLFL